MCDGGRCRSLSDVRQSGKEDGSGENNYGKKETERREKRSVASDRRTSAILRRARVRNGFIRSNVPNVTTISHTARQHLRQPLELARETAIVAITRSLYRLAAVIYRRALAETVIFARSFPPLVRVYFRISAVTPEPNPRTRSPREQRRKSSRTIVAAISVNDASTISPPLSRPDPPSCPSDLCRSIRRLTKQVVTPLCGNG